MLKFTCRIITCRSSIFGAKIDNCSISFIRVTTATKLKPLCNFVWNFKLAYPKAACNFRWYISHCKPLFCWGKNGKIDSDSNSNRGGRALVLRAPSRPHTFSSTWTMCASFPPLSLSLAHTHTHAHTFLQLMSGLFLLSEAMHQAE